MKDVHYIEADFEKAEKSIGSLIGKGVWGKGAIDSLKAVSKNLEEAESDIARLDADGAISFSHTDNKSKYQSLFEDFEVLYDFAGEAGSLVEDKIDQPFYEALDEFVEGMRDLDASKFTTKNRIGATTTMTTYANSYTREEIEVPKKEVSLDDLLSGDNYYADQMKIQYEEWKRQNKDQDVSQKDFRAAMINSRAFEYTSIKDEQQKKEFWVNVVATVAIVGVSIFCPPAGLALGVAYGTLEMSAAVRGKDWLTGRELDTSERVMRGAFSLLDIVPGMKAFSGGTQAIRSGSKLASLSDNVLKGMKNIPSKADDLIKLGKSKALTRINSLKTTAKEAVHRGIEKGIKGLDEVGKVADNFKGNLNLNSRRKLAVDGLGALPAGGTSKVANATEKMKDALRKYDLNLSSGRRGADDIIGESSKIVGKEASGVNDFVKGTATFDDVVEDYAKLYAEKVKSNKTWSWQDIVGGDKLTAKQRKEIKELAINSGDVPKINMKAETKYPDFAEAGVIYKIDGEHVIKDLPESLWLKTDKEQFQWLDSQLPNGVRPEGYTWHHSEISGKMELVEFGIHNSTWHKGGRAPGNWSHAPR